MLLSIAIRFDRHCLIQLKLFFNLLVTHLEQALVYGVKLDSAIKTSVHGNKSFQELLEHEKVKKLADELAELVDDELKSVRKATKASTMHVPFRA